jgi:hypothetical protein
VIDQQAAMAFATVLEKSNLKTLFLRNNDLDDMTFLALLPGLQKMPVEYFALGIQNLSSPTELVNLYLNKSFYHLFLYDISKTKISSQDLAAFSAKLAKDSNLHDLSLTIGLDDNDVSLLVKALNQNKILENFWARDNQYTVSGTRALMTVPEINTNIRYMDIDNLEAVSQEEMDLFYSRLNANRARP